MSGVGAPGIPKPPGLPSWGLLFCQCTHCPTCSGRLSSRDFVSVSRSSRKGPFAGLFAYIHIGRISADRRVSESRIGIYASRIHQCRSALPASRLARPPGGFWRPLKGLCLAPARACGGHALRPVSGGKSGAPSARYGVTRKPLRGDRVTKYDTCGSVRRHRRQPEPRPPRPTRGEGNQRARPPHRRRAAVTYRCALHPIGVRATVHARSGRARQRHAHCTGDASSFTAETVRPRGRPRSAVGPPGGRSRARLLSAGSGRSHGLSGPWAQTSPWTPSRVP